MEMRRPLGCDTFVVLPSQTKSGYMIFGKNSDRPGTEVQEVEFVPAAKYSPNTSLQCTYIEIPQVAETFAVVLSKPAWMWGAEMGANEHGVVIGNEAVWTKLNGPDDATERLLGMDLLRLGLERGKSAREALEVVTKLLEAHGQGGQCSEDIPDLTYHNSFLIADASEAWVLETAGREWAAEKVEARYRNISNNLTIRTKFELESGGLRSLAKEKGWWDGSGEFDFATIYALSGEACDEPRQIAGEKLLAASAGQFDICDMMNILRNTESGICRGIGSAFVSTGSQVSLIPPNSNKIPPVHFFTGTPDPSRSAFKPFIFAGPDTNGSPFVVSSKLDNDPAKKTPRFGAKVDRKHALYAQQEAALGGKHEKKSAEALLGELRDMEMVCIADIKAGIESGKGFDEPGLLFKDCCESEFILYKY